MTERTLILVKPDGVQRNLIGEVLARVERKGYRIVAMDLRVAARETLEEHYGEHREKPFFGDLVEYMGSGKIVAVVAEGDQVIAGFRSLAGATRPTEAAPGTIRGDFGRDWGTGQVENIVHGSDSPESAQREIALWFPNL